MDKGAPIPVDRSHRSPAGRAWRRFWENRAAAVGVVVVVVLVLSALVLPRILGKDPNALGEDRFSPPTRAHWLGTDANGRDLLARVCVGTRVSLLVGLAGACVSLGIGVLWGAVAGYVGGRLDALLMRAVDVLYALPSIIFVIVLMSALRGPVEGLLEAWWGEGGRDWSGIVFLVAGLGAVSWLTMARIVRAQVLGLRQRAFVEAARVAGAGPVWIVARHILPNVAGVVVVYLTLTVPAVVLGESFLSYLGLGIQPPQASLGTLIAEGAAQINPVRTQLWMLAGPGVVLVALLLALGFVGDGLRDAFDPRSGGG